MPEKRKLKRRHLIYYLRVFDKNTDELIGHLVDITPEGIMLMSEKPLTTKTVFQCWMILPGEVFGKNRLEFEAKSLWSKPDVNPDFFDTGLHLLNASDEDMYIINHLISDYGFDD
ncbi:MAG: PilZ domain-containing protein [Deltaproteobacteria bacterium]|nr:PilZ domain-containing protein [Deltaproteobacteria bacterium]